MVSAIAFQLFAPRNAAVAVKGTFSNWQEIPMQKGDDGYFRTDIDLDDGIYQYQFRVQSNSEALDRQWVDVTDPYAREIDRTSQHAIIHIADGKPVLDTYVWQHDDQALSSNEALVIYELHIADFCGEHPESDRSFFLQVIDRLDYLQELGINAIELMPITEYAGDYRWGYLVRFFMAPESAYGTPEDLKRLVDECHARGIRVLMDGIYNHSDPESPLLLIDRDYWYYHHRHYPDDPANYWGPEFNYEAEDQSLGIKPAWTFVGDVVRFWVQEYHLDGIRFDAVRQLGNYDFLNWITQEASNAAPNKPFFNIAEHIPDTAGITRAADGPMDSCWHESFRFFVLKHICEDHFDLDNLKEALDARRQGYRGTTNVINYLASHDREHVLTELGDRGIFDAAAFQRAKLGAVLLMTALGVPMIWMGDEFGEYKPKTETTTQPNQLQWQLLEQEPNHDLFRFYQSLIQLRKTNPALHSDNLEFFYEDAENRVLSFIRWSDSGARVVVVANLSNCNYGEYQITNFPDHPTWKRWLDGGTATAQDHTLLMALPAYTAIVLVSV